MGPASAANRRYPRVEIDTQGALDFRLPSQRGGRVEPELVRIPVAIRSISCEGVGIALGDQRWPLACGTTVTLYFIVDSQRFEIPGRVVWLAPQTVGGPMDAGVHFQLALAASAIRQSYATWIVDLLTRSQKTRPRAVALPVAASGGSRPHGAPRPASGTVAPSPSGGAPRPLGPGEMIKRPSGTPTRR